MNILYLGHYRENTELGISSLRFIHGLKQKYTNIAIRPVYQFRDQKLEPTEEISTLENNSFDNYDAVIQHTLPNLLSYNKNFGTNICVVNLSTLNIAQSIVPDYLNLMDEVYVRSTYSYNSIQHLLKNKCKIIYEPFEAIEKQDKYKSNMFKFFAYGDLTERYNLKKIVLAFLSEFSTEKLAQLILHVDDDIEKTAKMVSKVYDRLRIPVTDQNKVTILNEEKTQEIHKKILNNIDCSIVLDKVDNDGVSTIHNLLYDNLVITQKNSASCDFVNKDNGFIADSLEVEIDALSNRYDNSIYSIYESCYDTDISSLKRCMREAFCLTPAEKELKKLNIDKGKFSYEQFIKDLP